jgi:ribonuclease D
LTFLSGIDGCNTSNAGMFLGYRVPKGERTSSWAATHLCARQIRYAATDA